MKWTKERAKEYNTKYQREYYWKHREKMIERSRAWRRNNPEKMKAARLRDKQKRNEYSRRWQQENKDRARENRRNLRMNPSVRLREALCCRIRDALHGRVKSKRTIQLLGCSVNDLWIYLEIPRWHDKGKLWFRMARRSHNAVCHFRFKQARASDKMLPLLESTAFVCSR